MTIHENEASTNDACLRFHLMDEDTIIGFIEYYRFDRIVIITHTEVRTDLEGKGRGSELARRAVAYFQEEGKQIVPICGFFAQFLRKHPEYADAVTPESRRLFAI
jgi:predicted GNAT family acetyltransferase